MFRHFVLNTPLPHLPLAVFKLAGRGYQFPNYREVVTRDGRNPFGFVVSLVNLPDVEAQGVGRTKKDAKKDAARNLYQKLIGLSEVSDQVWDLG